MLPQQNRLPSYLIRDVMRRGRRIVGNGITMILDSRNEPDSRFAFVVSTKVDKRAVVRNRIRRLLSESVRHLLPSLPSTFDCVIIGNKQLIGLVQTQVESNLHEILYS